MFVKHVCPVNAHIPRYPKFNRGHLLVMNNHHTKLLIGQGLSMDGPTDLPTDQYVQSNIPPLLRRGA